MLFFAFDLKKNISNEISNDVWNSNEILNEILITIGIISSYWNSLKNTVDNVPTISTVWRKIKKKKKEGNIIEKCEKIFF